MRSLRISVAIVAVLVVLPTMAQVTLDRPFDEPTQYHVDTGFIGNASRAARVLHEEVVRIDTAGWLRVYFGDDVQLGEGSFLRITSELDGEVQELDAAGLEAWQNSTAYFNGDTVRVELVAGPQSQGNRLVIDKLAWEAGAVPTGGCGICGPDDRVSSDMDFAARLLPAGCSATVYTPQSCVVSAGHCITGGMVLQFKVPLSNSNCSLNHPPIADQFPVGTFSFSNGGVGNDWSVMIAEENNLGELPFDRYGAFMPIATSPPLTGDDVNIWGYGVDSQCIFSQTQQLSTGLITSVSSTFFNHNADATFGNSGSSVVRDGTEIVGIVTHCPCPNWATRFDHPTFTAARQNLCPTQAPEVANLVSADVIYGNLTAGGLAELGSSDDDYFVVDSILAGLRQNTLTEVTAQSPFSIVSQLDVRVEFGIANANPVFYTVQLFNVDTGGWQSLQFGIVSTAEETVVDQVAIPSPNDFVDSEGQIRMRIAQTAREVQTPDGFTKLVDQVLVSVAP